MAMTDGTLVAITKLAVTGRYPPQGVASTLSELRVSQSADVDPTSLTFGTASAQIDLITCSDRTYTAAGGATPSVNYDIFTGTDLKDLAGLTCAFRKVKYIQVSIVDGGDSAGVQIGGAGSNEWVGAFAAAGDKYKIFPGGPPFLGGLPGGITVDATHKQLLVENLGAVPVTVRIVIAGTSV